MSGFKGVILLWFYVIVVVPANLISHLFDIPILELISKPILMPVLMVFVGLNLIHLERKLGFLLIGALLFSWIGDLALLFDEQYPFLFMVGLGGFLVAHIQYIILFVKSSTKLQFFANSNWILVFIMVIYTGFLIFSLWPNLGELQIPVFVYATVLMLMGITAVGRTSEYGKILVLIGAVFFVLSDSILAINKFMESVEYGRVLTMLTYTGAQVLIVIGILKGIKKSTQSI